MRLLIFSSQLCCTSLVCIRIHVRCSCSRPSLLEPLDILVRLCNTHALATRPNAAVDDHRAEYDCKFGLCCSCCRLTCQCVSMGFTRA